MSHDGAAIMSHDGAAIMSHDGAAIMSHDGAAIMSHDGAARHYLYSSPAVGYGHQVLRASDGNDDILIKGLYSFKIWWKEL